MKFNNIRYYHHISSKKMSKNNFSNLTLNEKALLEAALPFLEDFLQEMGEFYPFAMIMDKNGVISSLKPDIDEEYPTSDYLIQLYETGIQKAFSSKTSKYRNAIICISIIIHDKEDKNAVECRFLQRDQSLRKYYIYYEILNGEYNWSTIV